MDSKKDIDVESMANEFDELKKELLNEMSNDNIDKEIDRIKEEILNPIIEQGELTFPKKTVDDAKHGKKIIGEVSSKINDVGNVISSTLIFVPIAITKLRQDTLEDVLHDFLGKLEAQNDRLLNPDKGVVKGEGCLDDIKKSAQIKNEQLIQYSVNLLKTTRDAIRMHRELMKAFADKELSMPFYQAFLNVLKSAEMSGNGNLCNGLWCVILKYLYEFGGFIVDEESPLNKVPRYYEKGKAILGEQKVDLSTGGAAGILNKLLSSLAKIDELYSQLILITEKLDELVNEIFTNNNKKNPSL